MEHKQFTLVEKIAYYEEVREFYAHQIFFLGNGSLVSKKGYTYRQEYNHALQRLRALYNEQRRLPKAD